MLELAAAAAAKSASAWDQPGTLGFIMVFGMAVILYFVFRSMSKHLRKVNEAARLEAMRAAAAAGGTGETPGSGAEAAGSQHTGAGPPGSSAAS